MIFEVWVDRNRGMCVTPTGSSVAVHSMKQKQSAMKGREKMSEIAEVGSASSKTVAHALS